MRTDVKVGLVCVLILVIAVVTYFALEGNKPTPTPSNEHAKATLAKTDGGTPAPAASAPNEMASPPAASPPTGMPPAAYSQTPIVPAPLGQTPTPYSPAASTTQPITSSPLSPASTARPLLPPQGPSSPTVPPLTNNATGEPGTVGPGTPSTPPTPSLGSEDRPGEPSTPHDDSMLIHGSAAPTARSHELPAYPPLTTGNSAGDYTVVSGDNLTRIAKKNHTTVAALKAANPGINPNVLKVKQVLKLPAAGAAAPTAPAATRPGHSSARSATHHGASPTGAAQTGNDHPASAAAGTYRVKKGDTLRKIAKSALGNESLWRRIFRMNRGELANPNDLKVGMLLKIPAH